MRILKSGCGCQPPSMERLQRRLWMRFLPGLRAYHCSSCGESFLASKQKISDILIAHRRNVFIATKNAVESS